MKTTKTMTQLKRRVQFLKTISTGLAMLLVLFYSKSAKAGDVGVYRITAPVSSCTNLSNAEKVSIIVVNHDSVAIDTIPVAYTIDNGTAVLDTIIQTLGAGDSLRFTFKTTADLSSRGIYTIRSYTSLRNDSNMANDTAMASVNSMRLFVGFSANGSCQGTAIGFTNSSTIDSGSLFYAWDFGDGIGASASANPTYTYNKPGSYQVKLVVNSTLGCKDSVTRTIIISTMPVARINAASTCIGSPTTFSDSSTIANGSITSTIWSFGDGDSSTTANPTHLYSTTGTYRAVLVITSDSGCSAMATDSITVSPLPVASFMAPSRICTGVAASFSDSSRGDSITYLWSFSDSATSTLQSPTHVFAKSGKYLVTLTVTSKAGCSAMMTDSVTVHASPVAAFGVSNVCSSDSARFENMSTISDSSVLNYTWNFGDTTTARYQNPAHLYANAGSYTAKEIVTSNAGCADSVSHVVVVNPLPTSGFTTTMNNTLTVMFQANDKTTGDTYLWSFGDSSVSDSGANPSHTFPKQGVYRVMLTVTNGTKCSVVSFDSVNVTSSGINQGLISDYKLDIYPNPFSGMTYINYNLVKSGLVNLSVYNETGKLITTIFDGTQGPGPYQYTFNAVDNAPAGLYLVKLSVDGSLSTKKIMQVK